MQPLSLVLGTFLNENEMVHAEDPGHESDHVVPSNGYQAQGVALQSSHAHHPAASRDCGGCSNLSARGHGLVFSCLAYMQNANVCKN